MGMMPGKLRSPRSILADRPFSHLLDISAITPLGNSGSGRAFRISDRQASTYKLRVCETESEAKELAHKIQKLSNVFPALIGWDRHYLLLEFIKKNRPEYARTQDKKQNALNFWFGVGKLMARVNTHPESGNQDEIDQFFLATLDRATQNGLLSISEQKRISDRYQKLREKYDYAFCIDIRDTFLPNFILTPSRLYYIDEGGLGHIRGLGLSASLKHLNCYAKRNADLFLRYLIAGYCQTYTEPLDPHYLLMVSFYEQMRRIALKLRKAEPLHLDIARLRAFKPCNLEPGK